MGIYFQQAQAVWLSGRRDVWNQVAGFYAAWHVEDAGASTLLRVTGADSYRIWVNGEFAGFGPARTAYGYARVDEWPLDAWLRDGENHIAIEVLSHGIDSYVSVLQPPFLQAEIVCDGTVVAATPDGFTACVLPERIQKVERFSKQRPFVEAYRLAPDCHAWRLGQGQRETLPCECVSELLLLPRHVPLPRFDCISPVENIAKGPVVVRDPVPELESTLARRAIGKRVRGYPLEELELDVSAELNQLEFVEESAESGQTTDSIPASGHALYDFGRVQGGFIGIRLQCSGATRVYLVFDETRRLDGTLGVGAITLELEPGEHVFESMAPYSFRFLRVVTMDNAISVDSLYVREYVHPQTDATVYKGSDDVLADVFSAARQTFRTNSIDLFTDCPSRERGGYPCDAWFTARAERVLTGESRVERNFLENYFLPEAFDGIPDGMVPHCYPSDRLGNGAYIPNWAMWLLLQLVDYCERTGDQALRDLARPRVEALVDWFQPHLNDLGLLENLPGWIFVDWSAANDYTEGINHPTNMLYAHCLDAIARLYERPEWGVVADGIRKAVLAESWDGRWFADQSIRVDGKLQKTAARTEACQYHALWTGVTDRDRMGDLWERLRDEWGPCREGPEELDPAGLLFGILLRFDLLQSHGETERLLDEIRAVFGPQAELTGTLWEHATPYASCNHGFAACACDYIHASMNDSGTKS